MLDLKLVQRYLMLNFWVMAGVCLLIVVLYETEVLLPLEQFDNPQLEFFLQVVMGVCLHHRHTCSPEALLHTVGASSAVGT